MTLKNSNKFIKNFYKFYHMYPIPRNKNNEYILIMRADRRGGLLSLADIYEMSTPKQGIKADSNPMPNSVFVFISFIPEVILDKGNF